MLILYYKVTIYHKEISSQITLNAKLTNQRVELSDYHLKFEFIKGIKNTSAEALLRLTDNNLMEPNPPEKDSYKYGYSIIKPLPDIDVSSLHPIPPDLNTDTVHLNIELEQLKELEELGLFCKSILKPLHSMKLCLMR